MNKGKTILILIGLLLLMAAAGEMLLPVFFEGYTGKAHLAVPVFFFVLYATSVAVMDKPIDSKHFVKQFMIFKSLKLILSLGALLAMCLAFREQALGVLVNFLIYSFAMMIVENLYVFDLKKKIVKNA